MKNFRFVFRVDASLEIGGGHLVRCCNFAKKLRQKKYEVLFVSRSLSKGFKEILSSGGFEFIELDYKTNNYSNILDAKATQKYINENDIVVIDSYKLDSSWEKIIKPQVHAIVVIDDLSDRSHYCDLLIDYNFYLKPNRYKNLLNQEAIQLMGTKYCILDENFKPYRRNKESLSKTPNKILIFFGSNDAFNLIRQTVEFLELHWPQKFFMIGVVGRSSVHNQDLELLVQSLKGRFELHIQTNQMAHLMESSDLFIGSGGTVTWERAIKGLPSVVIAVAENQIEAAKDLASEDIIKYVGFYPENGDKVWQNAKIELAELIENAEKRIALSVNSSNIVDDLGLIRIIDKIENNLINKMEL